MTTSARLFFAAALAAATLASLPAQAQKGTDPKIVSRDELRACMNSEDALAARRKDVEARNAAMAQESAAIRTEQKELAEEKQRLEEDQKPMDRFERKVRAHNAKVKEAQTKAEAVKADLVSLNDALIAHNQKCGGISFLPEDKEAIMKERAAKQ